MQMIAPHQCALRSLATDVWMMVGIPLTTTQLRAWLEERKLGVTKSLADKLVPDMTQIYLTEECTFPGHCVTVPNKWYYYGGHAGKDVLVCYAFRRLLGTSAPVIANKSMNAKWARSIGDVKLAVTRESFKCLVIIERPEVIRPGERERAARESVVALTCLSPESLVPSGQGT
jgi:hypothetical protein